MVTLQLRKTYKLKNKKKALRKLTVTRIAFGHPISTAEVLLLILSSISFFTIVPTWKIYSFHSYDQKNI